MLMRIKSLDEFGIEFDNDKTLQDYHSQDCCEHVYADWNGVEYQSVIPLPSSKVDISQVEFEENLFEKSIEKVDGVGFRLIGNLNGMPVKIMVPCYDHQNGYYSNNLSLQYNGEELDITECSLAEHS